MNTKTPAEAQAPAQETVVADDTTKTATETKDDAAEAAEDEETEETDAEAGEGEGEETSETTEGAEGAGETEEEGEKPTKSAQRRAKQKARVESLEAEVRRLADLVATTDRTKPLTDELGPRPERDKYEDEAEYAADLAAWKTEERILARQKKTHETTSTAVRSDAAAAKMNLFKERAMALSDRYPDIEAKVFNDPSLPMSATMAETIMESEKGPEIAYHLSANRELAQRIKSMTPLAAAMEIGRIEAKLSLPKSRTETKAPPPPPTVKGSVKGPAKDPEKMSMSEYAAWRAKGGGD